jgi:outer membrane protein assembly factor BamB
MRTSWLAAAALVGLCVLPAIGGSWPQFRGNATGRADAAKLPAEIGPDDHVKWKAPLPPGHSSPAVEGDRIYLTAVRDGKLLTMALDRATGEKRWEADAPHEKLEEIHRIGSHAQSSPATDGERVVTFFGSSGLFCYDTDGKLQWSHRMGPFKNDFGAGSSPIIVDDRVILCQDHDVGSFIAAYDKVSGKQLWRNERTDCFRNYCTPVVWEVNGRKQLVVAATLRIIGYDLETGREVWTAGGLSRVVCMTPTVGTDGNLYVAGWSAGGDAGERITIAPWADVVGQYDTDKNGTFEEGELPKGDVKQRFSQFDRDKDEHITKAEYEDFRGLFDKSQNVALAIRPGGEGNITDTHVLWRQDRNIPFCASPLYYGGHVFLVKDGGIMSSLDAKTGKPVKVARLPATGEYYSSPVAGDGKVYLLNEDGQLTVLKAEGKWEVLHKAEFGEAGYATPALVDGRIYLRTGGHLYCFGE